MVEQSGEHRLAIQHWSENCCGDGCNDHIPCTQRPIDKCANGIFRGQNRSSAWAVSLIYHTNSIVETKKLNAFITQDISICLCSRHDKCGIDAGEIRFVALVRPVIGYEYKARVDDQVYDLIKHFGYDQPVAVQTIVKQTKKYVVPMVKFLNQVLSASGPKVFLQGKESRFFGEMVSIAETKDVATTNRINSKRSFSYSMWHISRSVLFPLLISTIT